MNLNDISRTTLYVDGKQKLLKTHLGNPVQVSKKPLKYGRALRFPSRPAPSSKARIRQVQRMLRGLDGFVSQSVGSVFNG